MLEMGIIDPTEIETAITLTGASLIEDLAVLPGIAGNATKYATLVMAGQIAYAESYKWVYLTSIAFGGLSIIAACCLGNIEKYMTNRVAVPMH